MINIEEWGAIAGGIMAIASLGWMIVKPLMNSLANMNKTISETTETLTKVNHSLDLLNRDLEASKTDRGLIHDKLEKHDLRLDGHDLQLTKHDERINALLGSKEGADD